MSILYSAKSVTTVTTQNRFLLLFYFLFYLYFKLISILIRDIENEKRIEKAVTVVTVVTKDG